MQPFPWISLGSFLGFLSVALGAFGGHALRGRLSEKGLTLYQTAHFYHSVHALALILLGFWVLQNPTQRSAHWSGILLTMGTVLFSGSLYLMALTEFRPLGFVTPIGGLALMAGWLCFSWSSLKA